MSSLLPNLVADVSNLPWVAIIAVGGGILLTIVVIVGGLLIAHHRHKQLHETARLALEKGVPLPPAFAEEAKPSEPAEQSRYADIRSGLILVAVGIGLYVFLGALVGRALGLVGAIPGLIGVALLLFGLVNAFTSPKGPPTA